MQPSPEDIEIFPNRILGAKTAERLFEKISGIEGVEGLIIQGPRIKSDVREKIKFKGKEMELSVAVSRIILRSRDADKVVEKLREICNDLLPFGYSIRIGKFTKDYPTLHDYKLAYIMQLREDRGEEDEE
ncbi:MAG: methyl-coenzyme reductase subunit [Archaeoglobaceae archaeon]|nr:methyl-coenzyme reductase subunit [Archaeoglobaceae archaeon]MDK2877124.1 methyl-coenzyme reductase subunit [Archaeoglobaceae archaeon]